MLHMFHFGVHEDMIDIRDDESTQEYANCKERELMSMVWGAVGDEDKIRQCARAMADSVDAHILNDIMKGLT